MVAPSYDLHRDCNNLFCYRYQTVGHYPNYSVLLDEWKDGILYADGARRTVPMARMEQDLKEGNQDQAPHIVPWRVWSNRKAIFDRKVLIYSMLEVESLGQDLDDFMRPFHDAAVDAYERSKSKSGSTTTVMNQLMKVMSARWQARQMTHGPLNKQSMSPCSVCIDRHKA